MSSARILFCRCSHAQILPKTATDALLQKLRHSNVLFEEVADLCGLAARRDPLLKEFAARPGQVVACYPRAVKWLFAAASAPLPPQTQFLNLRTQSGDEIAAALELPAMRSGSKGACVGSQQSPDEQERLLTLALSSPIPHARDEEREGTPPEGWPPWFPVIDFDRCTQCMQCLGFCLFGVFGVGAHSKVEVQNPASCKTNCPACARVCPQSAILFPKHQSGPINGEEINPAELGKKAKVDISALLGGDVYARLRERGDRAKSRFSLERDPEQALQERRRCLAKLVEAGEIPPEVLAALPSSEEIQRRAQEASAKAKAALGEKGEAP